MKSNKNSQKLIFGLVCLGMASSVHAADSLFDIGVGVRSERFHWSISGNLEGTSPNILSELTWDDVDIGEIFINSETTFNNKAKLQTHIAYGSILSGKIQDSDYFADNRQGEFSRSIMDSEGDNTLDISASLGFELPVTDSKSTTVTPLVGISFRKADFELTKGFQAVDLFGISGVPVGRAFPGLRSSYDSEWESAFLGLQLDHFRGRWHWFGRFEYHDYTYSAKANWNLRTDFAHPVSFTHDSDGAGPSYSIGARRSFSANWDLYMNYSWWNWDSDNGSDTTYFADGTSERTHLKTAVTDGGTFYLGVTYTPGKMESKLAKN